MGRAILLVRALSVPSALPDWQAYPALSPDAGNNDLKGLEPEGWRWRFRLHHRRLGRPPEEAGEPSNWLDQLNRIQRNFAHQEDLGRLREHRGLRRSLRREGLAHQSADSTHVQPRLATVEHIPRQRGQGDSHPSSCGGPIRRRRGEFYDQEEWKGRHIWVRYLWFNVPPDAARMEQPFSADYGKTWEVNWICTLSRKKL